MMTSEEEEDEEIKFFRIYWHICLSISIYITECDVQ